MNGRTNVTVGTSTDFQIPLDPCTKLATIAGNAQVTLTWTDPVDKYATPAGDTAQDPQPLVSVWDHTVLVRKTGSQPTGPHDGTTVVSSSTRNQYQSTPYTDIGLMDGTTYYYGAFAYNTAGLVSEGIFDNATTIPVDSLGNLAVGTVVKTPISGSPREFIVVHQGKPDSMYDESCKGTWLLLKDIYRMMDWDSSTNDYRNSDIHSYLNGTFVKLFDANIQKVIKQVKIPYYNGPGSNGSVASGAHGLSCKIFLLSPHEVGWIDDNGGAWFPRDGAKLSYFISGTSSAANDKRIAIYNPYEVKVYSWWLRTPNTRNTDNIWNVNSSGYCPSTTHDTSLGIRPALVLPSNILVDDNLNILA